ncbi:MAG: hypothetical protein GOMPHAMPRED_000028 [Gomphillus americanus]|uniref:N-acetyltransferase domain-containing protein n=1 Tax=Gomphillus americanus TaxID=1940652 RepID=A0A8H3E9L7_9LECA|nr:MAG: hypothetical protein GOMPHAMPRED_000028 [Gomphillus americanus]
MAAVTEYPYKSAHLFYRPIESPQDDEFFHALQADAFSQDTSSPSLLMPMTRARSTEIRTEYQQAFISLIICLPTTDENLALAGGVYKKEDLLKPSLVRDEPFDQGIPVGAIYLGRASGMHRIHDNKASIGLDIAPKFQRRGYGREALNWILDWGFTHANLHRIQLRVLGWNPHALRLYQSVGFKLESHEKESNWHNGQYCDDYGLGE